MTITIKPWLWSRKIYMRFSQHKQPHPVSPESVTVVCVEGWDVSAFIRALLTVIISIACSDSHYFWLLQLENSRAGKHIVLWQLETASCQAISGTIIEYLTGFLIHWIIYLLLLLWNLFRKVKVFSLTSDKLIIDEFKMFPHYALNPFLGKTILEGRQNLMSESWHDKLGGIPLLVFFSVLFMMLPALTQKNHPHL